MTHSILDLLRQTVLHYGYWAIAATLLLENGGVPVPGETILLMASFLAYSEHELQLPWIIVVATIVTTAGGSLGFAVGYYGGRPLLTRYQSAFGVPQNTIARGESLFARFDAIAVFLARFVFGMRIVAGPLAGVLRMPWRKFLFWNFLGAAVWVTVISNVGYLFGRHWSRLIREIRQFDLAVLILVLLVAVICWWRSRQKLAGHPAS
jgi:membrane protein DedA with SNARE-associated domain